MLMVVRFGEEEELLETQAKITKSRSSVDLWCKKVGLEVDTWELLAKVTEEVFDFYQSQDQGM